MKSKGLRRPLAAALAVLASTLLVRAVADERQSPAKGDLWETISQMKMEGMPMQMPATKLKVCAAKDRTEPPGASNSQRNCRNSNMQRTGNKVTWEVQCKGPDMAGVGEIVYSGSDSYTGSIRFTSEQGSMTIALSGHRIGDCDHPQ